MHHTFKLEHAEVHPDLSRSLINQDKLELCGKWYKNAVIHKITLSVILVNWLVIVVWLKLNSIIHFVPACSDRTSMYYI